MVSAVRRSRAKAANANQEMLEHAAEAATLLRALGNEQRLCILCSLLDGPLSVGQINERVDLSQSALSQHLAVLRENGLVETQKEAQTVYYSVPHGPARKVLAEAAKDKKIIEKLKEKQQKRWKTEISQKELENLSEVNMQLALEPHFTTDNGGGA